MADVATTAVVYAAGTNPKAPINNLTALNFVGLSGDEGGVQQIASGEYTLSFDDTLTAQITCEVNGYQNNTQSWGNNPVPALLTFAMQKSGGVVGPSLSVQLDIASPPQPAQILARTSLVIAIWVQSSSLPLKSATIDWGDGSNPTVFGAALLQTLSGAGGTQISHAYQNQGRYVISATVVDQKSSAFTSLTVSIAPPAPPAAPSLWTSFIADNGTNGVLVSHTLDGKMWTNNVYINETSKLSPSSIIFNNQIYVAFISNDPSNKILVSYSPNGTNWSGNTYINQTSKLSPSLAVFNNKLYIAFVANDPSNAIFVCSSADGVKLVQQCLYQPNK